MSKPTVVCLCGSTRFKEAFLRANFQETMAGKIVLSVGWFSHADGHKYSPTTEEKLALDELHKRKIDLADEILILNVVGPVCMKCGKPVSSSEWSFRKSNCCGYGIWDKPYIGDSTRSELEYARAHGKAIRFLEPEDKA